MLLLLRIVNDVVGLVIIYFITVSPLVSAWQRRKRLKKVGLIKHRVRAFAWRFYDETTQERIAAKLTDNALFWAYALPDHKASAKEVVARELARRKFTQSQIADWSPDPKDVTVPPTFLKPVTWRKYRRVANNKARWFALFRLLLVPMFIAFIVGGVALDVVDKADKAFEPVGNDVRLVGFVGMTIGMNMILIPILFGVLYRKRALRILLLRPFGEKRMTKALRRFVPRNIGRLGHVFTLSDRNYRPNLVLSFLLMIPIQGFDFLVLFVLSPLLRNSFRIASIRKERHFRKLERSLIRQHRPSYFSFLTGAQAFNIRSTDSWWKLCIQMLLQSCEIIVVDVSKVKQGTDWELNQIRAKSLLSKSIFVVSEDAAEQAGPILERYFDAAEMPPIFVYHLNGRIRDREIFQDYFQAVASPNFEIR